MNTTLARWLKADAKMPVVDCAGCSRPAKCCAFQPFVPNFLLGGWLEDRDELPALANLYFQPIGAVALPEYRRRHENLPEDQRGVDLLCGFFDRVERSCTLWNFRPGECSTYFCDDQRESPERRFLSEQSFRIENAVAQMALVELGFESQEIAQQVDLLNGADTAKNYPGQDLVLMYKKAWKWSQNLEATVVQTWLE